MALRWAALTVFASLAVACNEGGDDLEGTPCERAWDCDGLECVAAETNGSEDLTPLTLSCSSERQGSGGPGEACTGGDQCASGVCVLAGACAAPCQGSEDCSQRQRCERVYARGHQGRFHPVDACVAFVDLPSDAQVRVQTRAAAFAGGNDLLELQPAESDTLFVVEHLDDDSWPVPSATSTCRPALCALTFEPRGGEADDPWFDSGQLSDADGPVNPIARGDHVYPLTVRVPAGPRAEPSASGYRLVVETKREGSARWTTISRSRSGPGRLDLNLYFGGARALEEDDGALVAALEEVDRIFAPADIFIGELRRNYIRGELLERGSDLPDAEVSRGFGELKLQYGVYPQLPELLALSAGAGNTALDVFFVASIESQAEADVGGIAGGTPIPFGMHGTGASGLVIATDGLADDPQQLGRRLAHEIAHALGLFHTVEMNGNVFDALLDTPVCETSRDRDRDGLDARDCEGAGADNLMFPTTDATASNLTPDQAEVLRRAMLLQ